MTYTEKHRTYIIFAHSNYSAGKFVTPLHIFELFKHVSLLLGEEAVREGPTITEAES